VLTYNSNKQRGCFRGTAWKLLGDGNVGDGKISDGKILNDADNEQDFVSAVPIQKVLLVR
jgi:hypothetical protein